MAIAVDPNQRIRVPLACADDVPEGERPHLLCRAMSRREMTEYHEIVAEAERAADDEAACATLERALGMAVRGWENVRDAETGRPTPFGPGAWREFTRLGLYALAVALPGELSLREADFFRSPLQRRSSSTPPAADTPAASATTPRPPETPTTSATSPARPAAGTRKGSRRVPPATVRGTPS